MLLCPSCRLEFDHNARFCRHCGTPRPVTTTDVTIPSQRSVEEPASDQNVQETLEKGGAEDTLVRKLPSGFFQQAARQIQISSEEKPASSPALARVKTPGEYTAFTIPTRPARAISNLTTPAAPALSTPDLATSADPGNPEEAPVDLAALVTLAKPAETPALPPQSTEMDSNGTVLAVESASAQATELPVDPATFATFPRPADASAEPYAPLKQELAALRMEITTSMDSLLPFVYENHRDENQALFARILAHRPPLDHEDWGHVAFVLGAYGNYMYRNPFGFEKMLEIWRAQLWAVYYERCFRRKYLAQRCQQLLHFFRASAENSRLLAIALHDMETLYLYLEASQLKKVAEELQMLPVPPTDLLRRVEAQMVVAEKQKEARMAALQEAQAAQKRQKAAKNAGQSAPASSLKQQTAKALNAHRQFIQTQSKQQPAAEQQEPALEISPAARKLLGFFNDEQCREFFASQYTARLETVNKLLQQVRRPLLMALSKELSAAGRLDYLRPRKSVPVRMGKKNGPDRFVEAYQLLCSSKPKEQQMGLRMFEQNTREEMKPGHVQLAREWMLYARASTQGSPLVASDWEYDLEQDLASWEEIWNLALFYYQQNGYLVETMRVLKPGLDEQRAPVSHLRLALICALTLLLEPGKTGSGAQPQARALLVTHLERWPHPLSSLAWLILAHEHHGSIRPIDQSRHLSIFRHLVERPVSLPDPRKDLPEPQFRALEEALVRQAHCDEAWFLWLNDYAERRPQSYMAWQKLAVTSEGMKRLERAETALQHMAEACYESDYAFYQEDEPQQSDELRHHLERLYEFYQRHNLHQKAMESFTSCYALLNYLWDKRNPLNRKLIALTAPYLEAYQRQQSEQAAKQRARAGSQLALPDLSRKPTMPLEHFQSGRRVGIFVDYENIASLVPRGVDAESVGKALVSYAAQFGEVVCQWFSASPRNLGNMADVRAGLEAAQFKVRTPRPELRFSASKKDLADFALLECISDAGTREQLDVYLIVSGDRDYYERIYTLLENGHIVRILAAPNENLSSRYRELEQQRLHTRKAAGHEESDFFIDDLTEILPPPASLH